MVNCPKCFEPMPLYQAYEIHVIPIFSEISRWISSIFDSVPIYPICEDCNSGRCVASAGDYWLCRTCACMVCPLCAVDFHRNHILTYCYLSMIKNFVNYYKRITATMYVKISMQFKVHIILSSFLTLHRIKKKFYPKV